MNAGTVKRIAQECGFELSGIASADAPIADFDRYEAWVSQGHAGEMGYLTDRRAELRRDVRNLLPSAQSVICVGKLYNTGDPFDAAPGPVRDLRTEPIISRYAQGRDYHDVLREGLERLKEQLLAVEPFEWKICVDTAPLLERSLARQAGLGWIGRNTCLINEPLGSWFFLGELITSLAIEPDSPPPDRCGTCTRCIEACPTQAFVPTSESRSDDGVEKSKLRSNDAPNQSQSRSDESSTWALDARRCISYLTIELHGPIPEEHRTAMGSHVFGCDICQDVCPWNSRAPVTHEPAFAAAETAPADRLAQLTDDEFRQLFNASPVARPKHRGFLRNMAIAMGNSGQERFREPLEHLAASTDPLVAEHARWALEKLAATVPPADSLLL